MKQKVTINRIREDEAILLAKKYSELKKQLESIHAHIDDYVIEYDDCFTDKQKINDILQNFFKVNFQ